MGWFGGGDNIFLAFYTISNISRKNNSGNKKTKYIFVLKNNSRSGQWESISNIYRKTTIVLLASEPVGGRSRATELPCYKFVCSVMRS